MLADEASWYAIETDTWTIWASGDIGGDDAFSMLVRIHQNVLQFVIAFLYLQIGGHDTSRPR